VQHIVYIPINSKPDYNFAAELDSLVDYASRASTAASTTLVGVINTNVNVTQLLQHMSNKKLLQNSQYSWVMPIGFGTSFRSLMDLDSSYYTQLLQGVMFISKDMSVWASVGYIYENNVIPTENCYYAYDSVLTLGIAINNAIAKSNGTGTSTSTTTTSGGGEITIDGSIIMDEIKRIDFLGASGRVIYDDHCDRVGLMYQVGIVVDDPIVQTMKLATWTFERYVVIIA